MLATQAVLKGVGVGSEAATPLAAAITWFTKNVVGMLSSILFTWSRGSVLDSDCKKWRLFADVVNDAAFCIELSTGGLLEEYAVSLLCLSSALKALVGVAGGSTRAALTHHQAIRGNTADVAAKDGSQETVVNLAVISFGVFLMKMPLVQNYSWLVMIILTMCHIFCNYRAVKALKLRKFNEARFLLTFQAVENSSGVISVGDVNLQESAILGFGISSNDVCGFNIFMGKSLNRCLEGGKLLNANDHISCNYLLVYYTSVRKINIVFRNSITNREMLQAYYHGLLLGRCITSKSDSLEDCTYEKVSLRFLKFTEVCEQEGWIMDEHLLRVDEWRGEWINKDD